MNDPRFPLGPFVFPDPDEIPEDRREAWIEDLVLLPEDLITMTTSLDEDQLDATYREDGWTVRQIVHHLADSHMTGFERTKLALTEDIPVIKPYAEALWAELPDAEDDIQASLTILQAVHHRWAYLLRSLEEAEWESAIFHPEQERELTLNELVGQYAWHGRHHLAHIRLALEG